MSRKTKRELQAQIEELDSGSDDDTITVAVNRTVVDGEGETVEELTETYEL